MRQFIRDTLDARHIYRCTWREAIRIARIIRAEDGDTLHYGILS